MQEAIWWHGLKYQLGKAKPLQMFCDNQSALALSKNGGFNPRTKHIDIRHHFIQDTLNRGNINLNYVRFDEQIADVLTKSLDKRKIQYFRDKLGIKSSQFKKDCYEK
jgi:hypothetical protein